MSSRPEVEVTDNPATSRYEAHVEGELAGALYYREQPDGLVLVHTEVADEFEGKGVGGRLVAGALDDIRRRGLNVTPVCPFASGYIDRHPEYADLIAA
ncbi:MAG: GNAT family N-acetyltransferase [Gaiellaceae bacterium]|jgi:predicted GNAT family acetyltransferase